MFRSFVFVCAFFIPQIAFGANVYVPVICQVIPGGSLDCDLNHVDATEISPGVWDVQVASGDTVFFQVSDFTQGSTTYAMAATTWYSPTVSVTWTKPGTTATSPGEVPTSALDVLFEAEDSSEGKPKLPSRPLIRVRPKGG